MFGCKCGLGLSNTGLPNCVTLQSVTTRLILVPIKNSSNLYNRVSLLSLPNFNNLFNAVNYKDRWYPLETFDNVEIPIADSTFEETASGRKFFVKSGKRSFSGDMYLQSPEIMNIINSFACTQVGVFMVDANGNLIGIKDGDYLYPIPINSKSLDPKLSFAGDSNVQKLTLSFDFLTSTDETKLWLLPYSETSFDFNLVSGIKDIVISNTDAVFDGFLIDYLLIDVVYKNAENDILISGLNPSLFKLFIILFDFNGDPLPIREAVNGVDLTWVITDLGNGKYKIDIANNNFAGILYGIKYFVGGFDMSSSFFSPYEKQIF